MKNSSWMILGAGLGFGLALAATACVDGAFACSSDANCLDGSSLGVCQPDGWCSFEDPECDSSQRYGEHASADLAGTCVPLDDGSSSGSVDPPDPDPDPSVGTTGPSDSSGEPPDPGTTGPSIPPSTTTTTDGGTSDDGIGESDSGPVEPGCVPVIFDDFDDGAIDPLWETWQDPGALQEEADRVIRFSITEQVTGGIDTGLISRDSFDFSEGYVRIEIAEPPTGETMRLYWQMVSADECITGAFIQGGLIFADNEAEDLGDTTWLQVRTENGNFHIERSVDGEVWEPAVPPQPTMCDLREAQVYLFGGVGEDSPPGATTAVETIEVCAGGSA